MRPIKNFIISTANIEKFYEINSKHWKIKIENGKFKNEKIENGNYDIWILKLWYQSKHWKSKIENYGIWNPKLWYLEIVKIKSWNTSNIENWNYDVNSKHWKVLWYHHIVSKHWNYQKLKIVKIKNQKSKLWYCQQIKENINMKNLFLSSNKRKY